MITYRHEQFIEQAVRSVLMQQTSGPIEVLISDDASPDATAAKLRSLSAEFPGRLTLNLRTQNVGMLRNFAETLSACRGKYVAILEGDDYWTDPHKLQRQADYLDAHPEAAICHHNAWRVVEGSAETPALCHSQPVPNRLTLRDLMSRNPIVTCTTMYRRGCFETFPEWYFQLPMGDWPLHILNAQQGSIGYLPEPMAAYRVHSSSNWSSRPRLEELRTIIGAMTVMLPHLPSNCQPLMMDTLQVYHEEVVQLLFKQGDFAEAGKYAASYLTHQGGYSRLKHFYRGLDCEQRGERWAANLHFLQAAWHGWGRTVVRAPDIALAMLRNTFPWLYRQVREVYRRCSNSGT